MDNPIPPPVESRQIQPFRSAPIAIERREPTRFTTQVKLAGNGMAVLGGVVAWIPITILCLLGTTGLIQVTAALAVSLLWVMSIIDSTALWENRPLREASYRDLQGKHPELSRQTLGFVGLSTHTYLFRQFPHLDTHEDVGMLCGASSALVFRGDRLNLSIQRGAITAIQFRPDPCFSMIGLHWIRITYEEAGTPHYIYVQSRDKDRLSQISGPNGRLLENLQHWWRATPRTNKE